MLNEFPKLTGRLSFINFCPDQLKNFEIWNGFSMLESHVYGVISQYQRIKENLMNTTDLYSSTQVRLDIYYYTLTWDKLKRVFEVNKRQINNILGGSNSLPSDFKSDFKHIKTRIEHLLRAFETSVRNEYEHPSLLPSKVGNLIGWGNMIIDGQGNIMAHVGSEEYAIVRKEHVNRLSKLWVEYTDVFVNHFTDKELSSNLLQLKDQFEENIDSYVDELNQLRADKQDQEAGQLFGKLIMLHTFLMRENMPVRKETRDKLFSVY